MYETSHQALRQPWILQFMICLVKQKRNQSIKLFGGTRSSIETDLTISVNDPSVMASDAQAAIARGFRTLKIKVGINPSLDVERLIAAAPGSWKRYHYPRRCNQAWNAHQAVDLGCRKFSHMQSIWN